MNGFVLLDKAEGITSNQALQRVKRILKIKKAGHTGSLDPLATGILPIAMGEATKFSQFLLDANKHYCVTAQLGARTDTYDKQGKFIAHHVVPKLTAADIAAILRRFIGKIEQTAPSYSALKYQGKPLYHYARQGVAVPLKQRQIEIYQLKLLDFQVDKFSLQVHCSKGTYIRSLIEDIGLAIGCGAYVTQLRRTQIDGLDHRLLCLEAQLKKYIAAQAALPMVSIEQALKHLPQLNLTKIEAAAIKLGQKLSKPADDNNVVTLFDENQAFIGIGEYTSAGELKAKRLLAV
ncbi:MAG: tRNA pseudouridine(55) synthase TruB [Pseudomonadota bacterium]